MKQHGFTLVEILMALLISTIIALLTFTGLDTLIRIQHRLSKTNQHYAELQSAFWRFTQDTAQLQRARWLDTQNDLMPSFALTPNSLSLITAQTPKLDMPWPSTGLLRVNYSLNNGTLYRTAYPIQNQAFTTIPLQEPLVSGVTKVSFLALDKNNQWQTSMELNSGANTNEPTNSIKAIEVIVYFHEQQVHRIFPVINPLLADQNHESA